MVLGAAFVCRPDQSGGNNAMDAQGFYRLGPLNDPIGNASFGTNFWVAFYSMLNTSVHLSIYISSPVGASGTVTIPGFGITNTFTLAAGAVTNVQISSAAMMTDYDAVESYGIQITASQPVSVYGVDYSQYTSSSFTGYPTALLGTNYCVMARASLDDSIADAGSYSQFAIVATANNTTVRIMSSATANLWNHSFGTNYYETNMNEGQTYQIHSNDITNDVTGTWITSDKPIAVFAGASGANVPDIRTAAANPLVQEQLPVESWGTMTLALSFAGRTNGDSYRVLAAYSNTVVTITGTVVEVVNSNSIPYTVTTSNETVVVTNQAGVPFDIIVEGPVIFQASQPIQVAQFANGVLFDHGPPSYEGDPCEILLPPTGHYLVTNTIVILPNDGENGDSDENFLNLIVAQSAITNTLVDGSIVATTNFVAIGASGYYGAQLSVTNGTHKVTSSRPVGVEVYGWGRADAYGYFGGVVK